MDVSRKRPKGDWQEVIRLAGQKVGWKVLIDFYFRLELN
jgi:methenyltetrahydromethanopterin cyclohydrolase